MKLVYTLLLVAASALNAAGQGRDPEVYVYQVTAEKCAWIYSFTYQPCVQSVTVVIAHPDPTVRAFRVALSYTDSAGKAITVVDFIDGTNYWVTGTVFFLDDVKVIQAEVTALTSSGVTTVR